LPSEWLEELGVEQSALFAPENDGALREMVTRLIDRVAIYEASARTGVGRLPFRSRLAVLSALRIYGAIGRRVRELGSSAWEKRVSVGKMRKLAFVVPSFAEALARR
jgi:phytoene synthase